MTANKRQSRFQRHVRQIGLAQALRVKALEVVGVRTAVNIRMCGTPFYARTRTHDLVIAAQFLCERPWEDLDVHPGSPIIDAGANIGASTVYLARKFPDSKVIALEPERENFALLEKNTSSLRNVNCIRKALWHEQTSMNLFDPSGGTIAFSVSGVGLEGSPTGQNVDCVTIESLCNQFEIDSIGFLKLDIEGAEKQVLENSAGWMDRVQILAVELHDRSVPGCEQAYKLATADFFRFEKRDDKSFAFRAQ